MKNIFKSLGFVALYCITYFIASIICGMALGIFITIKKVSEGNVDMQSLANNIQSDMLKYPLLIIIGTSIISLILLWIILLIRKENLIKTCRFKNVSLKSLGSIGIAGISLSILTGYILNFILQLPQLEKFIPDYGKIISQVTDGNIYAVILITGILLPIFEEIFFRGIIFNELRKNMNIVAAVIIQGTIFGIFHFNIIQSVYTLFIGILFGLVLIWYKSIWASIVFHIFFNTTSVLLEKIAPQQIMENYWVIILLSSALITAGALYFIQSNRIIVNPSTLGDTDEINELEGGSHI